MASTDKPVGEPQPTDKEYVEIIRSDVDVDKKFIDETGLPTKIIYFCQDCNKVITPKRIGKKFQFSCSECKGKNVAFGTEKSIESYYKKAQKESKAKTEK